MRLSTRGRYGTRLMVDLAQHYANGPIPLAEIARRQDLSAKYLEQLIILLKGAGLIRSTRGRRGGYTLARKPEEISVGQIVEVLEETQQLGWKGSGYTFCKNNCESICEVIGNIYENKDLLKDLLNENKNI